MTFDGEVWKPCPGHTGYEVSNLGRVGCVLPRQKYAKPPAERRVLSLGKSAKYLLANVAFDSGRRGTEKVHRLVLEAFVGPCPEGMEACHNNGVGTDNRLENLRWDTKVSNARDKFVHGVVALGDDHWSRKKPERVLRGSRSPMAKMTEDTVPLIRAERAKGLTYRQIADALRDRGVTRTMAFDVCTGRRWKHVA